MNYTPKDFFAEAVFRFIILLTRVLVLPFVLGVYIIASVGVWIRTTFLFLTYGGEFTTYYKEFNRSTISDLVKAIDTKLEKKE